MSGNAPSPASGLTALVALSHEGRGVVDMNLCTDEYALRRVVERRVSLEREPVALFEDLVDLVNVALAVTRRSPGA